MTRVTRYIDHYRVEVEHGDPEIVVLNADVARRLAALLERVERTSDNEGDFCPSCNHWDYNGHRHDCELAALRAALDGLVGP